jgi:uncharacterized protein YegJ (DUF2314 family)
MKKIFFLFILIASEISVLGQGEPGIYNTDDSDAEMNAAIKKSRVTFTEFSTAFEKQQGFSHAVKVSFPTKNGGEHIWLSDIQKKNGKFYGKVDNTPEDVPSVKLGDIVEIDPAKISDWLYIDEGKLVGGFTIRVIRDRMTPAERKQFDKDFGVKID